MVVLDPKIHYAEDPGGLGVLYHHHVAIGVFGLDRHVQVVAGLVFAPPLILVSTMASASVLCLLCAVLRSRWCQSGFNITLVLGLRVKHNHRTEGVNALGEPTTLAHVRRHLRRLPQGTRLYKLHMAGREAISAKISYTCGRSDQGRGS